MRRRIYYSFAGLLLPSVLLLSALLGLLFHGTARAQEIAAIKDRAALAADLLDKGLDGSLRFADFTNLDPESARLTVIAPDGTVLLDSKANAAGMENHGDRAEVAEALRFGVGEAVRDSSTIGSETYYYAVRLSDGNVLRVSKTTGSIAGAFASSLPAIFASAVLILVFANFAARRLTKRIVDPIAAIGFTVDAALPPVGAPADVYDELLPYVRKIDGQRREISQRIAELESRADTIEAITGNMKEGLVLIDNDGLILAANKSARDIFGDMERKAMVHICRDQEFQLRVGLCLAGGNAEMSLKRGGKIFSVLFSPVHSGGAIFFFDVTERTMAEQRRKEFSANVSHELKTPLTTICALSEMIGAGMAKPGDVARFAGRISEQAGRLIAVIDDIIKLSEFDEGSASKERTEFCLYDLAEEAAVAFRGNAKGVAVLLSGERFGITANRRMVDELLCNLIDNGVKYNKDGGTVSIEVSREGGEGGEGGHADAQGGPLCKISVSDTGIGIPEQHQAYVFERFYRVDKSRSKKTGGTGLGLSIVKHIAECHGGRVELESAEGAGTTVTCYLRG